MTFVPSVHRYVQHHQCRGSVAEHDRLHGLLRIGQPVPVCHEAVEIELPVGNEPGDPPHIRAGGVSRDVIFVEPGKDVADRIDEAFRAKYRRYPKNIVDTTLTAKARAATLRLVPSP